MPVGAHARLRLINNQCANIGGSEIFFQTCVKYLGVKIDQSLTMKNQISSVCRAAFLELRRIASISITVFRQFLSRSATAKLMNAFITSRLDYCNSVLAGLPSEQIFRLQRVQNSLAQLVMKKRKHDHMTPVLKKLHWLPVNFRIQFKIATLAFRHFDGSLPAYLSLCTYHSISHLTLCAPLTQNS